MVNIDSGKYEVEVSKKEDNWYEVYGTDNMIKTSMCLSLALNEKAILSMDGYSAGELIFDDGDSCNVEGSTLVFVCELDLGSVRSVVFIQLCKDIK